MNTPADRPQPPPAPIEPVDRRFSLLWLVPVAALIVAAVLAWQGLMERGVPIAIAFTQAHGLSPGDAVVHRGVRVGTVSDVRLRPDLDGVIVQARIRRDAQGLLVEGARFWVVRPELNLREVSGLETLFGSRYVAVEPGPPGGRRARAFQGDERRPRVPAADSGSDGSLSIVLLAARRGSLAVGSPVLYRDIRVGSVRSFRLSDDARHVAITALIDPPYTPLIRDQTRFWAVSGIGIEGGLLSGFSLSVPSLEAVVEGGIALAVPERRPGEPVEAGHVFELAEKPESDWLQWAPAIPLDLPDPTP